MAPLADFTENDAIPQHDTIWRQLLLGHEQEAGEEEQKEVDGSGASVHWSHSFGGAGTRSNSCSCGQNCDPDHEGF